jgi:nitrogen fixation/metabolism regulation signal transduction histidine kinase
VKLLTNPIVLRMALVLFAAAFSFVMAALLMRRIRKSLGDEAAETKTTGDQLPLHTYHAVIQQLKQQKHELLALQQAEHRRAKASENLSATVLSNLSCGVLFFGSNGLARQANQAAKKILGIASPTGMNAEAIFRSDSVSATVRSVMRDGTPLLRVDTEYATPANEPRVIEVTVSRVPADDGTMLGVACLINDQTDIAEIRRQIDERGELSAEMALALRNSLVTISGYARQLAQNHDPDLARQLADDIAAEAKHLDRTIGGFLAQSIKAQNQRPRSASASS